jgi:hypothetical protein
VVAVADVVFRVVDDILEVVSGFQYLGRYLSGDDNDELAIKRNLRKAHKKWGRFGKLLCHEGAKPKTMAKFYLAVVQAVLLYGATNSTRIVSKRALNRLRSFHHRCARYITRRHIRKDENDEWICPTSAEVLELVGLKTIDEYITKRKNTLKRYATSRAIYLECERSRPLTTSAAPLVWWT